MRETFLPFAKPSLSEEAISEVVDSLRSGWLTTGPKLKKFEAMLREYHKVQYALCLSSATAGLQLALMALELKPGDEVITTPMTFAATLNVIEIVGATVKLVDVDRGTYNIDINNIEAAITDKTRVIMPVHFAGLPVDLDPIYSLAQKYNLTVIEDAAHSIGAEYKGRKIGSFGDIQVFSFHPNKNMTTGEGGCVVTRDNDVAKHISLTRFHGMDREAWNRFGKEGSAHYQIVYPGYKYNMMDLQAALGLHQLPFLDVFIEKRTKLVKRYYRKLAGFDPLILPKQPQYVHKHAWHLFAPTLNSDVAKISRDEFMSKLKQMNIGCSVHYEAVHLYPYYANKYGFKKGDFPNAEAIGENVVSLPLFPDMTEREQDDVLEALYTIFN
ncbi:DegT/DnrJ/EryC1/StrS family aminotransferase [Fastidiosibacter lacustris]|uniref:DegT/DnrJ/EryC1/StrS family aminotransferase n=1 Tax=Fastidiosibacter lacustris TaxID=2056695 RepID=UPI000E357336|nr:DegT/DnrJ/EryC1/StrS family aminotransferase [Fastidiosibacter lacustris]